MLFDPDAFTAKGLTWTEEAQEIEADQGAGAVAEPIAEAPNPDPIIPQAPDEPRRPERATLLTFTLPDYPTEVRAFLSLDSGRLDLQPERSVHHRALIEAMG